ncbi:MAG: UDP-N-acetylmuramoyl-tripeptide--D-alanyl-D-alanine ligase [Hallerella sp.]|nr:UDP-N-acetylmuramoyl-tripeptide--D-alanyl-D-alanine ligase [Hallerella sp.]
MQKLDITVKEFCEILESSPVGLSARAAKRKVNLCLDSREAGPGVVFWPLKGARFDAHSFIPEVMKKGALMSVMDAGRANESLADVYVPVDDSNQALLKLAKGYQRLFSVKKIAVTGSNGKTTTKEMLKAVLSAQFKTMATEGNLNNQIGVPKTLFRLKHSDEVAVVEMGTNAPGEIHPLSMAVEPDIAVITNIGASHLERLQDLDHVFKEKVTITDGLKKNGLLVVNADDSRLSKLRTNKSYRVLTFGIKRGVIKPENLKWDANACASFKIGRTEFHLSVPGIHNVYNALAAIAVATSLRMPKSVIADALEKFHAANMRMEIRNGVGIKVVSDCYNANPSSTRMALQTIGAITNAGRKIAILGDMLELGDKAEELHHEIGELVPQMKFDMLVAVGKLSRNTQKGALDAGMEKDCAVHFETVEEAMEFLSENVHFGDVLLVKGSRGMKMEQVVDKLLRLEPAMTNK